MLPLTRVLILCMVTVLCHASVPALVTIADDTDNLALNRPAKQSSTNSLYAATEAVDGNLRTDMKQNSCSSTLPSSGWHWWLVDLQKVHTIGSIRITNRADCCSDRLKNFTVEVSATEPSVLEGFPGGTESPVCMSRVNPVPPGIVSFQCNEPVTGRYVRVLKKSSDADFSLALCELEVFKAQSPIPALNLALHKPAKQSSVHNHFGELFPADRAVDGNTNPDMHGGSCSHTDSSDRWQWWMVDLQGVYTIGYIRITNRVDCCDHRLRDFTVEVSEEEPSSLKGFPGKSEAPVCTSRVTAVPPGMLTLKCDKPIAGRYIRVVKHTGHDEPLMLCEIEVFEGPAETTPTTLTMNSLPIQIQAPMYEQWLGWRQRLMSGLKANEGLTTQARCNIAQ